MTTELAVRSGSALTIAVDQPYWTDQQVAALHQLGLSDACPADLQVFFHQCQRTGLDPFARQIHMIGRNERYQDENKQWRSRKKYTIQTGIDGFRLIGRRAATDNSETLEVSDTQWCGTNGRWVDVWLSPEPPSAARVAIVRNGGRFPAVALYSEYVQKKTDGAINRMWSDRPRAGQLEKCAEALAWRRAFPQDLSGLYTTDEIGGEVHMPQIEAPEPPVRPPVENRAPPLAQAKARVWNLSKLANPQLTSDERTAWIQTELDAMGSSIADADTATWNSLADALDGLAAGVVDADLIADETGPEAAT